MTPQQDKGTKSKRKTSSQPSLISNYFKKVDSPSQKGQSTLAPFPTPRNGKSSPDLPRPTSPVSDDDNNEGHPRKRTRFQTPPSDGSLRVTTPVGEKNALTTLMSPKIKEFRPPPESPRTSRYKYLGSSTGTNEVEAFTPEQLAKKQSLHERFVQKLGKPDSVATLRRPSETETPLEEEEQEEEEEELPPVKSLRGKYTAPGGKRVTAAKKSTSESTTKFTPLERQYVEIKKQYPDTLLLIEVGYKFRFFGEDAKVSRDIDYQADGRLLQRN
jgi:DNA mismatch repair protein MSH3